MSREMHQIDDEPTPRLSRFSIESQGGKTRPDQTRREAMIESDDSYHDDLSRESRAPETTPPGRPSRHEAVAEKAANSRSGQGIGRHFVQVISSVVGVGDVTAALYS